MLNCYADLETKSECDLKKHGTAVYAEHPTTDIQIFRYAFEDGEVKLWSKEEGHPMPNDLKAAFANPDVIFWYHNAWFDRNLIENVLKIKIPLNRYRCSMAAALSHGLPASLEALGTVLGLKEDFRKIKDGKRLVMKFCKPKKQSDGSFKWATPKTDPDDWARYLEYSGNDVIAMRECIKKTPKWNYPKQDNELALWLLDQKINSRGMYMDLTLANSAMDAIDLAQQDLAKATKRMTNGDVDTAGQRDAMIKHIANIYGYDLPNMQKAAIERLVEDVNTPFALKELLSVRLSSSTTSTAKYKKIVDVTSADSRVRGTLQYCGASRTGRDGGRMIQPQNLARPVLEHDLILQGIDALKGSYAEVAGFDVMKLTSSALRYTICAPEGSKLAISDLAGIENRVLAWLANEEWKLDAFRAFDAGTGHDLYKMAYAKAFGIDPKDVTKEQRFLGKILELALGYSSGCGGLLAFMTAYNVDLNDLVENVMPVVPEDVLKDAKGFYKWQDSFDIKAAKVKAEKAKDGDNWEAYYTAKRTLFLSEEVFVALESLKRLWRLSNPAIVQFWADTELAVRKAVNLPNTDHPFGNGCIARKSGSWVRIVLPGGHNICYPGMKTLDDGQLVFMGVGQFTKKWEQTKTYSGKLVENCFTEDVLVLTPKGNVKIIDIKKGDKVWDGYGWVETDGVIYRGKKEVGTWLKIKVTSNHQMLGVNGWNIVGKMGLKESLTALKLALSLTPLPLLFQDTEVIKNPYVNALAVIQEKCLTNLYMLETLSHVETVFTKLFQLNKKIILKVEKYLEICLPMNSTILGGIGIQECLEGVITQNAQNTKITAVEGYLSTKNGYPIKERFLSTLKPYLDGMKKILIWTGLIMKKDMFQGTYNLLKGKRILGIPEITTSSIIKIKSTRFRNLWKLFYQIGKAITPFTTTYPKIDQLNGLWQSTMKEENVYDLLNCGEHSRFTIVTPYGPVIVHNCSQAFARDIFKHGQLKAEAAGYKVVLAVHDELVTEVPDTDQYTSKELEKIMAIVPEWAGDIPLAAAGFESYQYRKD